MILKGIQAKNFIQDRIADGTICKKLYREAQGRHIKGQPYYVSEKSIFSGNEAQAWAIIQQVLGTGEVTFQFDKVNGRYTNIKEVVDVGKTVGEAKNLKGGSKKTNRIKIHYGKKGIHIVPAW